MWPHSAAFHLQGSSGKLCCTSPPFNSSQPTSLKTCPLSVRLSLKTNSNSQSRANQAAEAYGGVRAKAQHFLPSCEELPDQYWALGRLSFECKCLILNISPHVTRHLICLRNPTQEAIRCLSGSHQHSQNHARIRNTAVSSPCSHCQCCGPKPMPAGVWCHKTFGTKCCMILEDTGSWQERSSWLLRNCPKG